MAGFLAMMVAIGLAAAVAVMLIASKVGQRKAKHRRAMQDLVRGRTSRSTTSENTTLDAPRPGGAAPAFMAEPQRNQPIGRTATEETAALIRQSQNITRLAKDKASASEQDKEDAMVRHAERMHAQLAAEIERENRGPRSRPSGPCTLQISYVDADGVWSTRKIAPYKSGNTNQKFDAWCDTREYRRTFFFERIQSAVDLTTGRTLTQAEVFQRIHPGRRIPADLR